MSHTPGPWTILCSEDRRGARTVPKITQPGKAGIVATLGWPGEGDRTANARLIAAAPEMLEALRDTVAQLDHQGHLTWGDVRSLVIAAIAKAEGQ